jgi:hypothetical protein
MKAIQRQARRLLAVLAMTVCKRAWNVARRSEPKAIPGDNPFQKMGLEYKAKTTRLFDHDALVKFVAAADEAGEHSIGTAAVIAFFWLQREGDIIGRLGWTHYRPSSAPGTVKIFHHKTDEEVDLPLYDIDGSALWPELMARLDATERHGTLIVTRDNSQRHGGALEPSPCLQLHVDSYQSDVRPIPFIIYWASNRTSFSDSLAIPRSAISGRAHSTTAPAP